MIVRRSLAIAALAVAAVILGAAFAGAASAAPSVSVKGASAVSKTAVEISFDTAVDSTATNATAYVITSSDGSLAVSAATLTSSHAVILTTDLQTNAIVYTVSVSGITNLTGTQTAQFIGTSLGSNSATSFQDDFNRLSGLATSDTPIGGPWTSHLVAPGWGSTLTIAAGPALQGAGALRSYDASIDPTNDDCDVQAKISGKDFFLSAYVDVPSNSGWQAGQDVGLLRLDTGPDTAQARLTAAYLSSAAFTLSVNWKVLSGSYLYPEPTGLVLPVSLSFGSWHWLVLHARNGVAGVGEIQVFVDGRLISQNNTTGVRQATMTYALAGIMHYVAPPGVSDPSATTHTDQVRLSTSYTMPSIITDSTPPAVTMTSPADGATIHDPTEFTAVATDDVAVQRVDWVIDDSKVVASQDFGTGAGGSTFSKTFTPGAPSDPLSLGIADGTHTLVARAYDTSGDVTNTAPITVTIDSSGPSLGAPHLTPATGIFSPNWNWTTGKAAGDGYADKLYVEYTTSETATQVVSVLHGSTTVRTLATLTGQAAGAQHIGWDGTYYDAASKTNKPVADGAYTLRVSATDSSGRTTRQDFAVVVNRTLGFVSRSPAIFNPARASMGGSYELAANATVTVTIEREDGTTVRTLLPPTAQTGAQAGTGTLYATPIWDGKDDGSSVVPDGTYVERVSASNAIGTSDQTKTVVVDTTAPLITLDSLSPFPTWDATGGVLTVQFTVNEAGTAQVKYALGSVTQRTITVSAAGGAQYTTTWNGTLSDGVTAAPLGSYRVKIYFTDRAGNAATSYPVQSDLFTMERSAPPDTTPPVTTSNAPRTWVKHTVLVALSATDAGSGMSGGQAGTWCSLNGGPWTAGTSVVVSRNGINTLRYYSKDAAVNLEATRVVAVRIDRYGPRTAALARVTVRRGYRALFSLRVSDVTPQATVTLRIYSGRRLVKTLALGKQKTGVRLSYRWRCTLARGTYRWTVGAVDLAGNRQVKTGVTTLIVR